MYLIDEIMHFPKAPMEVVYEQLEKVRLDPFDLNKAVAEPRNDAKIEYSVIQRGYTAAFAEVRGGWRFADRYYDYAYMKRIQWLVDATAIDRIAYDADNYDCDDFTFALMGMGHLFADIAAMALFVTWTLFPYNQRIYYHSLASVYTKVGANDMVLLIEPQNDVIYPVPPDWQLVLLCG